MPRRVPNYWIECNIDGRKTTLAGGPPGKDGGFQMVIYARDDGGVVRALFVRGYCNGNGELRLSARDCVRGKNWAIDTKR